MTEMTPEDRLQRFFFFYRDLFKGQKLSKSEFLYCLKQIPQEDPGNQVVYFEGLSYQALLASYLMAVGKYKNVQVLNAYKLIEIYLDKDEEWKSISDIECEILVITLGYAEFPNKQQGNIINQVIEQQLSRGQKFWLFVRGSSGLSAYPEVQKCLEARQFKQNHIKFNPAQVVGEVL